MAAPAGVSSGSVPEPVVPEPPATEPMALGPAIPEPPEPVPGENTAATADLEAPEAAPGENTADIAVPEPTGPAYDQNTADIADPEYQPPQIEPARQRRGVGWLVTTGVVIVVLGVAAAAGALVVATHGFRPKTIVSYRPAAVFGLRAGECINSSPNGLSVTRLSCATPHEAEVFATYRLSGSVWPGTAAVQQQANSGCADRMAGYLNPQLLNAGLVQQFVYPNKQAWQAGERTVVCEVSSSSGPLTGSVRQSG
jgi:hypothetical protein